MTPNPIIIFETKTTERATNAGVCKIRNARRSNTASATASKPMYGVQTKQ